MKRICLIAALAAGAAAGCGKKPVPPAQATPEMEAEQKQSEADVRNAEAAVRKGQKAERNSDQRVDDEERARRR
jgi:predicted small lipoprotein YifL